MEPSQTNQETRRHHQTTESSEGFFVHSTTDEIREDLHHGHHTSHSLSHLKKMLSLSDLRQAWSSYEASKVLGKNIFDKGRLETIRRNCLNSRSVLDTISQESKRTSLAAAQSRADEIANQMMASMTESVIRPMAYVASKVVRQLYSAIHVVESELQMLRDVAAEANESNTSLVFLPTHKSHIDYVVIELLWLHCNISLPFIAAGINLDIPVIGPLFHNCGAFFINRPFPNDPIYKAIFHEYLGLLLEEGYNIEFFLEGGRSRSGKLLPPRLGMLQSLVHSIMSGRAKDCHLIPISISYDKVIETGTYIQELLGKRKQPESFRSFIQSVELLRLNFGQIDIRLGKPRQLREMINEFLTGRGLNFASQETLMRSTHSAATLVAYSMLYDMNDISVATPSALVVTVLLTNIGRGMGRKDLIEGVAWLRHQISIRGGRISVFGMGNIERMVDQVTFLLRSCIDRRMEQTLEIVYSPSKRFELSFYRNSLIHLFVSEATLACALYGGVREVKSSVTVDRDVVAKETRFLSTLFKWEFIYKPKARDAFHDNFEQTLQEMVSKNIIQFDKEKNTIAISPHGKKSYSFLCAFLWPFIEAYWMTFIALWALHPNVMVEAKEFLTNAQYFAQTLYYEGELTFFEAISSERISLALSRFQEMGIVSRQALGGDKGLGVLRLTPEYQDKEKMRETAEHLGKFRRFAKYSKEPNFSSRVRRLATMIVKQKPKL